MSELTQDSDSGTDRSAPDSIDNDDETPEQDAIDWIRYRIKLKGFDVSDDTVWTEEHEMTISDFLASPSISRLVVYNDKRRGISLDTQTVPAVERVIGSQLQYFLK
eukprot:140738_1